MTRRHTLVVATGNAHKVAEFTQLLRPHGIIDVAGAPKGFAPIEHGDTFAANATIKVLALRALQPEGEMPSILLADDSGLVVPALQGAPGVHSARYAQEAPEHRQDPDGANCRKLLDALRDAPPQDRRAYFICAVAVMQIGSVVRVFSGSVHGHIATAPKGSMGFGYDPLFVPEGHSQTFAELGPDVKHQLSHRARAVAAWLAETGPGNLLSPTRS